MKRIFAVLVIAFAATAKAGPTAAETSKPVIVLVPGFFNSLAPGSLKGPYFSNTILKTLGKAGTVVVADNLSPVGGIVENGNLLSTFLTDTMTRFPGRQIMLFTHSAGGYYAFYALTHHNEFPVKTVVTMALPYRGVEWITNLTIAYPELEGIADFLSLASLKEFEMDNALKMGQSFVLPEGLRVIALGGTQEPCSVLRLTCTQADHLSWPLSITQKVMSEASDGIVTIDSAMGKGVTLHSAGGRSIAIERWSDINMGLEHWEMVLDGGVAPLVGVVNPDSINQQQAKIYSSILQRLSLLK